MDLNLVRVFVAIFESRSLTAAAARLFVTQSAVSQSLARLRAELDDPLFERAGRTMEPTPLATRVFPSFHDALAGIERALDDVHGFDPATAERTFRIAMSELGEIGWLAGIAQAIRSRAPKARLEVVPLQPDLLADGLARGTIDLAITPLDLPGGADRTVVKLEAYGVAMSASNPLADGPLTIEDYVAAPQVGVLSDSALPLLEAAQHRAGAHVTPAVSVWHFATLPALLTADPGLIATLPASITTGWAERWHLVVREPPFPMEPVRLCIYRRTASQRPAALDWFFETVTHVVTGSRGRFDTLQGGPDDRP
jgi:DNA-binding transcriptional LysR family regulator